MFGKLFETKAKTDSSVMQAVAKMTGGSPIYSKTDYKTVAKEGYSENHVIFRCMREIIMGCTQAEFVVKKNNKNGEPEDIPNHPALNLINKPNPSQSREAIIERMVAFYYLSGEAPIHKITSGKNVLAFYCYRPDCIEFTATGDSTAPYSNIKYNANSKTPIDAKNFTLIKSFNPLDEYDGLGRGFSLLSPAFKNGDLLNAFIDWNVSLLQNGARPSGAWVSEAELDDDSYQRAKKQLKNNHTGTRNAGKVLLLEGGVKWERMGDSPKDMDWTEGKKSTIIDICSAMGVDPILCGYNEFSSYNNKKEAKKELYTSVCMPLMAKFTGELTNFFGLAEGEWMEADFSHLPVMQEDEAEKSKKINESKDLTINEKRVLRGKDPVAGGDVIGENVIVIDGKVYIPLNYTEVGADLEPKKGAESKSFEY